MLNCPSLVFSRFRTNTSAVDTNALNTQVTKKDITMNTPIKPSTLSALIASSLFLPSFVASAFASDSDLHAIAAAPSAARIAADLDTLVGFGTFKTAKRKARKGRNPQTGKEINIPARNVPKFVPGKALKDSVK